VIYTGRPVIHRQRKAQYVTCIWLK